MATSTSAYTRLDWAWLALGAALFSAATVQHVIPAAAWLAPIFLLRFARSRRPATLPALILGLSAGAAVALNGYLGPAPAWLSLALPLSYGLIFSLPYAIDALVGARLAGAARTLVFPAAFTALDWLLRFHPFPNFGSPAYTQFGNLPLMQLASVTGIWGITFLIAWGAAAANAAWEAGWERRALAAHLAPFGLALAAALLYGGARIALADPRGPVVQVAAIAPNPGLWSYPPVAELARAADAERAACGARAAAGVDDLLARSEAAAAAGAQIVVWAETAAFVPAEDAPAVLARAAALARERGIFLQVGLGSILRADSFPFAENRAILFDPRGEVVWDYHKGHLVPVGDAAEMAPGPRAVPTLDTPLGRLATVICYDAAFAGYTRQAGQAGVDILFVPANDWYENRFDHAAIHVFRAIENGAALVRPTAKGITYVTDHLGRVLAQSDYYASAPTAVTMTAVPARGEPTLYARIGDSFAYASMALLAGLALLALRGRRAPATAAVPA